MLPLQQVNPGKEEQGRSEHGAECHVLPNWAIADCAGPDTTCTLLCHAAQQLQNMIMWSSATHATRCQMEDKPKSLPENGDDAIEGSRQIREVEAAELAGGVGHGKDHGVLLPLEPVLNAQLPEDVHHVGVGALQGRKQQSVHATRPQHLGSMPCSVPSQGDV